MTDTEDPVAVELERRRAAQRASTLRWRANHRPEYEETMRRERKADSHLRERHYDEWLRTLAAEREKLEAERGGDAPKATYRSRASRALRKRFQAEWDALVAAAS